MLYPAVRPVPSKLLSIDFPFQQLPERGGIDAARKAEIRGDATSPFGRRLATFGIVVADRIIARQIIRRALQAPRMDHAGLASSRVPSWRSCWRNRSPDGLPYRERTGTG